MYFRFVDNVKFLHNEANAPESEMTRLVEFARRTLTNVLNFFITPPDCLSFTPAFESEIFFQTAVLARNL